MTPLNCEIEHPAPEGAPEEINEPEPPRLVGALISAAVRLGGAAAAAAVVVWPWNNTGVAIFVAALCGALAATALDAALLKGLGCPRAGALVRLVVLAGVGAAVGNWFRLDPEWAFRLAFREESVPAGVRNLKVQGTFLGRQSDRSIWFVFDAGPATAAKLLHGRGYERDAIAEAWACDAGDWQAGWEQTFRTSLSSAPPEFLRTMRPCALEIWYRSARNSTDTAAFVWEPAAGRMYAHYSY